MGLFSKEAKPEPKECEDYALSTKQSALLAAVFILVKKLGNCVPIVKRDGSLDALSYSYSGVEVWQNRDKPICFKGERFELHNKPAYDVHEPPVFAKGDWHDVEDALSSLVIMAAFDDCLKW